MLEIAPQERPVCSTKNAPCLFKKIGRDDFDRTIKDVPPDFFVVGRYYGFYKQAAPMELKKIISKSLLNSGRTSFL
jgi:hypothetical protein